MSVISPYWTIGAGTGAGTGDPLDGSDPNMVQLWAQTTIPREWFHPEYLRRVYDWRFFDISYAGGRRYTLSIFPLTLFSHERETATSYQDRRRRAFYRNHCEAIIGLKADAIYQPRVQRRQADDPGFVEFLKNVDLKGTNADPFWNNAARLGLAFGRAYVGIAMSTAPELQAMAVAEGRTITAEEAKNADVRPFYYAINPLSVIDWDEDDRGRLTYAIIISRVKKRTPLLKRNAEPAPMQTIARVLLPDREDFYEIGPRGGQTLIKSIPHPFGEVPLVPVMIRADGHSQIEDIAPINRTVFNNDSMANEQIFRQTFNQLVAKVKDRSSFMDNVKGTDTLLCVGEGEDIVYLAPNGQTIVTIREESSALVDEMWAMAHLRTRPGAKGAQPAAETSGVAYAFEHKEAEADLANIASRMEEVELRLGIMRARALELDPAGVQVQYPTQFDIRALLTRANEVQQLLGVNLGKTAAAELRKGLARTALPRASAEDLEKIDEEIGELGNAKPPAPPMPPNQGMMPPGKGAAQGPGEKPLTGWAAEKKAPGTPGVDPPADEPGEPSEAA